LRVIAGVAKGRRLAVPSTKVRPTGDRVREALFTMLEANLGGLEGLRVADVACGSGALGIEALSRGAAGCAFVDLAAASLRTARANVAAVGLGHLPVSFVRADLLAWAARQRAGAFDLVLVDPPYAWDGWSELLDGLAGVTATVAAESDREIATPSGWASLRTRRYGGTVVSVLVRDEEQDR